jgi:hypothetical protein
MDSLQIVRLWAAAAWADNELHPREEAALRKLIASKPDLDADALSEAHGYLQSRPEFDGASAGDLSLPDRQDVYRAAQQIIAIDGQLTDDEMTFLANLRLSLELDPRSRRKMIRRHSPTRVSYIHSIVSR